MHHRDATEEHHSLSKLSTQGCLVGAIAKNITHSLTRPIRQVGARSLVAPTGIAPASQHRQLLACGAQDTVTGSGADLQTIQQQLSFEKQLSWTQSDKEF